MSAQSILQQLNQASEAQKNIVREAVDEILALLDAKQSEPAYLIKPIYSEPEAAEFLGVSKNILQKFRRDGQISSINLSLGGAKGAHSFTIQALLEFALEREHLVKPRTFKRALFLEKENKK